MVLQIMVKNTRMESSHRYKIKTVYPAVNCLGRSDSSSIIPDAIGIGVPLGTQNIFKSSSYSSADVFYCSAIRHLRVHINSNFTTPFERRYIASPLVTCAGLMVASNGLMNNIRCVINYFSSTRRKQRYTL